jgi:hypothetical protein
MRVNLLRTLCGASAGRGPAPEIKGINATNQNCALDQGYIQ